jgi:NADH-quinone oxidoreductase subunit J
LLAVVLVAELVLGIGAYRAGAVKLGTPEAGAASVIDSVPNIEAIGSLLYSKYIFLFESAGLILLVAMVGAIVLTHRKSHNAKSQSISSQVQRRPQDATRNVSCEKDSLHYRHPELVSGHQTAVRCAETRSA